MSGPEHEILQFRDRKDPSVVREVDVTALTLEAENSVLAHMKQRTISQTPDEIDIQKQLVNLSLSDRERVLEEMVRLNKLRVEQAAKGQLAGHKQGDYLPQLELIKDGSSDNPHLLLESVPPPDTDPTHSGLRRWWTDFNAVRQEVFEEENYSENGKKVEHVLWPLDRSHTDPEKP